VAKVKLYFTKINSELVQIGTGPYLNEGHCDEYGRVRNYQELRHCDVEIEDGCGIEAVDRLFGELKVNSVYILEGTFKQVPKRDLQQTNS